MLKQDDNGHLIQLPFTRLKQARGMVGYSGPVRSLSVDLHGEEESKLFDQLKARWGMESNAATICEALRYAVVAEGLLLPEEKEDQS